MKLSLYQNRILIHLEKSESFLAIQDSTKFNLCYEYVDGHYTVPYVCFPLLHDIAKKLKYQLELTPTFDKYYRQTTAKRLYLFKLKGQSKLTKLNVSSRGTTVPNGSASTDDANCKFLSAASIPELGDSDPNCYLNDELYDAIKEIQAEYGYELTPEQEVSVAYSIIGKRIIVANGIGTGKTITINTVGKLLLKFKQVNKVLIMLPSALVKNYVEDYIKFFGNKGILSVSSTMTPKKREDLYHKFMVTTNINFLVVNYDKCNFDYELLQKLKIDMLIVDEFHNMKNFLTAKRSQNFFELVTKFWKPKFRYPMSGTPIENKLFDLFPIFKLIDGGYMLGGDKFFSENFVKYENVNIPIWSKRIQKYTIRIEKKAIGFKNEGYLNKLIRPLIIRKNLRLKTGCYPVDIMLDPSTELLEKYEEIKKNYIGQSSKAYHAVRQFLCDPSLNGYSKNAKLDKFQEIIEQTDEKFVIFSFYKCTIRMLEAWLAEHGHCSFKITGDESEDPFTTIQKFRRSTARFLIATDKINYGQNIQFCRYMVQWEKSMKPTTEEQRIGRLYRTGQENDVHIYTFTTKNTVEERIFDNFQAKKDVIKGIIDPLNDVKMKEIEDLIEREVMKEFK